MDALTEAERRIVGDVMESLGWRRLGDTEFDREVERGLSKIILPSYYEGLREVCRQSLVDLYQARFGDIPEPLREGIEAIVATNDEDTMLRWVVLAGTGSAEEIAAAFLGI
jgi:hypothetical protein